MFQYITNSDAVISLPWTRHICCLKHDDVIKWKHFSRYWPFVRGIHRSPVNSAHKGQWRGALMFTLICVWINGGVNNRKAGDLRLNRVHYDVIVMYYPYVCWCTFNWSSICHNDGNFLCAGISFILGSFSAYRSEWSRPNHNIPNTDSVSNICGNAQGSCTGHDISYVMMWFSGLFFFHIDCVSYSYNFTINCLVWDKDFTHST